jgi:hypothetical protein
MQVEMNINGGFVPTPGSTQHCAASSMPNFHQSLDRSRPSVLLDIRTDALRKKNKWPGNLVYEFTDNGEQVIVPNCWHNQPAAWRAEALRWEAGRRREKHAQLVASGVAVDAPGRGIFYSAEAYRQDLMREALSMAEKLEGLALEMERTGVVTH